MRVHADVHSQQVYSLLCSTKKSTRLLFKIVAALFIYASLRAVCALTQTRRGLSRPLARSRSVITDVTQHSQHQLGKSGACQWRGDQHEHSQQFQDGRDSLENFATFLACLSANILLLRVNESVREGISIRCIVLDKCEH